MRTHLLPLLAGALLAGILAAPARAQSAPAAQPPRFALVTTHRYGFDLRSVRADVAPAVKSAAQSAKPQWGAYVLSVRWRAPDVVELHLLPDAHAGSDTLVLDPHRVPGHYAPQLQQDARGDVIQRSPQMRLRWNPTAQRLQVSDARGKPLLTVDDVDALVRGRIALAASPQDALYGLGGYSKSSDSSAGILRTGAWTVKAG